VPELTRPDGTRIHYEVRGDSGPPVVLGTYWTWSPGVYEPLLDELASDHRVVTYHLRGTGQSSRRGPYDMETDSGDLEALLEEIEGAALLFSTADGTNRAARVAVRRPDLVAALITFGTAPIARAQFTDSEGMLGSDSVVGAFFETFERNYRTGLRTLIEATNQQMSEDELRERIDVQAEFSPQEAALGRLRAWMEDDPGADARALGDRLWIFSAGGVAGPWLPPKEELDRMTAETLPDAHVAEIEPGPVSRPDLVAEMMRRVSAPLRAGKPG
jgi:pimeloyl-ACP methyl ester carboxylesterase